MKFLLLIFIGFYCFINCSYSQSVNLLAGLNYKYINDTINNIIIDKKNNTAYLKNYDSAKVVLDTYNFLNKHNKQNTIILLSYDVRSINIFNELISGNIINIDEANFLKMSLKELYTLVIIKNYKVCGLGNESCIPTNKISYVLNVDTYRSILIGSASVLIANFISLFIKDNFYSKQITLKSTNIDDNNLISQDSHKYKKVNKQEAVSQTDNQSSSKPLLSDKILILDNQNQN
jgi:hypothetical protein